LEKKPLSNMNGTGLPAPLKLFWREDLYDELVALEDKVLPGIAWPTRAPTIGEDKWGQFISDFLARIPEHETDIAGVDLPALPPSGGARALHWRIAQALSVVGGRLPQEIQGRPEANVLTSHEVLLPMQLRARLQLVLGYAAIPMVWVRSTTLAALKPARQRPQRPD